MPRPQITALTGAAPEEQLESTQLMRPSLARAATELGLARAAAATSDDLGVARAFEALRTLP